MDLDIFCDDGSVIRHRACLIIKPPMSNKSNDLVLYMADKMGDSLGSAETELIERAYHLACYQSSKRAWIMIWTWSSHNDVCLLDFP